MSLSNIKEYMWPIFEISRSQKLTNIHLALDMFVFNVEHSKVRYKGATNVDYAKLHEEWSILPDEKKNSLRVEFDRIIDKYYNRLCLAFDDKDKEKFEELLKHL